MRLLHRHAAGEGVLASEVEVADSTLTRARGLMFRRSVPGDYALAFPFDGADDRWLHMLFVPFDIDAVWTVEGEVRRVERLRAWTGVARAEADAIFELPAGTAADVTAGDRVELVGGDGERGGSKVPGGRSGRS
ncbi:MAG: DUF192 domain-containing protein [Haloferacaceae archaeon]